MSTFCISYLKDVILLQDSLKNCIPDFLYSFFFKSYTHKVTNFLDLFNISPFYSQTKHDIKNLRNSLVVTDIRRNQANWPIDKGTESFEIIPQPVQLSTRTLQ